MKKFLVTAAALTLGTSALAWAPADKAQWSGGSDAATESKAAWSGGKAGWSARTDKSVGKTENAALAAYESAKTASGAMKATMASLGDKGLAKLGDASVKMAAAETKSADQAKVLTASWDGAKHGGMGGPEEAVESYPPCDPGRGDDRCIQLYERGVATALAQWKSGADADAAMGGPFEPAPATGKEQADHQGPNHGSSGQGATTSHGTGSGAHANHDMAKPDADTGAAGKPADATDVTGSTTPGAIGGPVEARTGYPPCRPGRGDDRCIQLYERGVTGRDN